MSVVSGVTLVTFLDETKPVEEIKAWIAEHRMGQLAQVDDHFGGWKHPQCDVFGGGFNFLDEDAFADFVLAREWDHPERVVLVIQPEEGATRVFRPEHRR
jgi:hypothetical protein